MKINHYTAFYPLILKFPWDKTVRFFVGHFDYHTWHPKKTKANMVQMVEKENKKLIFQKHLRKTIWMELPPKFYFLRGKTSEKPFWKKKNRKERSEQTKIGSEVNWVLATLQHPFLQRLL